MKNGFGKLKYPSELWERKDLQVMFSVLTQNEVNSYSMDLYSKEFEHELRGLFNGQQ